MCLVYCWFKLGFPESSAAVEKFVPTTGAVSMAVYSGVQMQVDDVPLQELWLFVDLDQECHLNDCIHNLIFFFLILVVTPPF